MIRYKICIEYNGYNYNGWQHQKNARSIQNTLQQAIYSLTQQNVIVYGAGRTDAKVHAYQQVAHFDLPTQWNLHNLVHGINFYLKNTQISVFNAQMFNLPDNTDPATVFHARYSAKQREYIYKIVNKPYPDVLQQNLAWWVAKPINVTLMQQAGNMLIGTHDFSSFRASNCYAKSPIKTINTLVVEKHNNNINITVSAPSFLYHQVRNIVGALVKVGLQNITLTQFNNILQSKDRKKSPATAPAHGLYFNKVIY